MDRIDSLITELCKEIDFWKNEASFYKIKYEKILKNYNDSISDSIEHNNTMTAHLIKSYLDKGIKL